MKELKFRAWWKDTKRFLDGDEWYMTCSGAKHLHYSVYPYSDDDFIIEQYTGLKDKNGKEIYEGDIIQEEIDLNSTMTDGTFKYRVYWDEEELCWGLEHIGEESIHDELWQCNSSTEVVGNIHQGEEKE